MSADTTQDGGAMALHATRKPRKTRNRVKSIFYAPREVREFIKFQARQHAMSQSEVVVELIQNSPPYKQTLTKEPHGRL